MVSHHPDIKVDTAFSALAASSCGRWYVGYIGFDTEYQNRFTLSDPEIGITVDRIFTTPSDLQNHLDVSWISPQLNVPLEVEDSFKRFFASIIGEIGKHCWSAFAENLG